jgi:hypothetical protein
MSTWHKFWRLRRRDRTLAVQAAAIIIATRVGLRAFGFQRWKSTLARLSSSKSARQPEYHSRMRGDSTHSPSDVARVVSGVARNLFFHPTCLERSMGLWSLLRRRGFDAELHIGARKADERFEAHAWVECGGGVLGDAGDEHLRFSTFSDSHPVGARQVR